MKLSFRRAFALAGAFVLSLPLFAAEGDIVITPATDVLTKMQTALTSYWDAAQPFIVAIVGIVVVVALIWAGVRLFRGGASKISGR